MQFLNPWLLLGLVAVLIPIIVHLFNFRRYKKLFFSNVKFLKELQQRTRKQSKLLHRLILLARIMTIVFIALSFAQPFFARKSDVSLHKQKIVSIYVDNSFSMETEGSRGALFEEAKDKAREIVSAYSQDDQFQLLTNDFEGKHHRLVSKDEFNTMLGDVVVSPAVRSLKEISARQKDVLDQMSNRTALVHYVSDFQRTTVFGALPDTGIAAGFLIPLKAGSGNNLYIDSCWFDNPVVQLNEQAVLNVRLTNVSDIRLEKIPVRLMIENTQRAVASVDIDAGTSQQISFTFSNNTPGQLGGYIEINDFPVTYDDIYYFSFRISPEINVLALNDDKPNPYISSVFSVDSIIRLTNTTVRQVDLSSLSSYSLIILNELKSASTGLILELSKFAENGGSVLFIPSPDATVESQNAVLSGLSLDIINGLDASPLKLARINTAHPLYREVFEQGSLNAENLDYPVINAHFNTSVSSASKGETLLELANGQYLLSTQAYGAGKVYQFTAPLNDKAGNFVRHALYVPTMLNIAFQSEKVNPIMYYTDYLAPISVMGSFSGKDDVLKVTSIDGEVEFIPGLRQMNGQNYILLNGQVTKAGIYSVSMGGTVIDRLAFNFNRNESDLKTASDEELEKLSEATGYEVISHSPKPLNEVITDEVKGENIWKWFIMAALLSALIEVLLLIYARRRVSVTV